MNFFYFVLSIPIEQAFSKNAVTRALIPYLTSKCFETSSEKVVNEKEKKYRTKSKMGSLVISYIGTKM